MDDGRKAIVAMVNIDGSDGWGFLGVADGLIAGKPAPTGSEVITKSVAVGNPCGSWLASDEAGTSNIRLN
ncbi:hypothetical protein [Pseudomonas sp. TNT2022 ID642]|uniref:hypothetical protein n=1 Tax=Pseudomonas sp. TNT2022 ID642 TaxID=2942632 RepID=UPI00235DC982|nr:hypothetical protein [Pseudomonas sp. TNT2022 ID642]MDD1005664.1 hypothetical protein [Pseudomonas sp. TNT2022 ID642]